MSSQTETAPDLGALGELIRQRRQAARLTQGALASRAGVGRSTIHRLERRDVRPLCPTARTVATVLEALAIRPAAVAAMVGGDVWGLEVFARLEDLGWPTGREKEERWLRPEQAAEHLGIGTGALQRLKRAGIPHHPMDNNNGLCIYLASELDTWRASHARRPTTPPRSEPRKPRYQPQPTARRGRRDSNGASDNHVRVAMTNHPSHRSL